MHLPTYFYHYHIIALWSYLFATLKGEIITYDLKERDLPHELEMHRNIKKAKQPLS